MHKVIYTNEQNLNSLELNHCKSKKEKYDNLPNESDNGYFINVKINSNILSKN